MYRERVLKGHGADVKCVDWHPQKSIIISGSKDSQQPIKLWDADLGKVWLPLVAWHPIYEDFFASGGSDGSLKFWSVGTDKEVGTNDTAHEGFIWSIAWHPLGHILVTGSNDHSTKFWARNKPGDTMKDRYNLNLLPIEGEEDEVASSNVSELSTQLPGMGLDEETMQHLQASKKDGIPGLDMDGTDQTSETFIQERRGRYTYTKKIDKSFAAAWEGRAPPSRMQAPPGHPPQGNPNHPSSHGLLGPQPFPPSSGSLLGDAPRQDNHAPPPTSGLLDTPNNQSEQREHWSDNVNNGYANKRPDHRGPPGMFNGPPHNFNGPGNDFRGPNPRSFNNNQRNWGGGRGGRWNGRGSNRNNFRSGPY